MKLYAKDKLNRCCCVCLAMCRCCRMACCCCRNFIESFSNRWNYSAVPDAV